MFLGSSSALGLASLIGALAGGSIAAVIRTDVLQLLASIGFLVIGGRLLWPLVSRDAETSDGEPANQD